MYSNHKVDHFPMWKVNESALKNGQGWLSEKAMNKLFHDQVSSVLQLLCWLINNVGFLNTSRERCFWSFPSIGSITNNANNFLFTPSGQSRWVPSGFWICSSILPIKEFFLTTVSPCYFWRVLLYTYRQTYVQSSQFDVWCFWMLGGSWSTDAVTGRTRKGQKILLRGVRGQC